MLLRRMCTTSTGSVATPSVLRTARETATSSTDTSSAATKAGYQVRTPDLCAPSEEELLGSTTAMFRNKPPTHV
eukprot:2021854-Rhodomonas_salina.2